MKIRTVLTIAISLLLISAVFVGAVSAYTTSAAMVDKSALENVRAFAPAVEDGGTSFALDGGELFVGEPGNWIQVRVPRNVIVNAVAIDARNNNVVYIGAANELAIYRSGDAGQRWQRIPLTSDFIGAVTDIAVDSQQRLLYVGTDTAGLFRLRDVGSSVIVSGQLLLDEPVLEVTVDPAGSGLGFARTEWNLYRAEDFGLRWLQVDNLGTVATAVAFAETTPATVYVGTTDRGLLKSADGLTWNTANEGLGMTPGTRLRIDALAVDPLDPNVLYVASSYLFGSTTIHVTPAGVAMSADGAASWAALDVPTDVAVAELLPVSGEVGGAFALMANSRTPLALGNAEMIAEANAEAAVVTAAKEPVTGTSWAAWIVAGLAALTLLFALGTDIARRRRSAAGTLAPSLVRHLR